MTEAGAERAVTTSALIVAGVYTYRRLTEGSGPPAKSSSKTAQLLGVGSPPGIGVFITAWGMAFLILAIITEVAPGLGGSLAILVATADALSNTQQVASDVNTKVGAAATPLTSTPAPQQAPHGTVQHSVAGVQAATLGGLGDFNRGLRGVL